MNLSSRETSGISLPPPVAEQQPGQSDGAGSTGTPENLAAAPETAPGTGMAQPAMSQPVAQPAAQAQPPVVPAGGAAADGRAAGAPSASKTVPLSDDQDKVEKEWVDKARKIVEHTKYDPHRQSEELTVVKADYMKQRYNKIIKVEK